MPLISVVIPTYNRPEELRSCLRGLASQTAARADFEAVVVDDGSTSDTEAVLAEYADAVEIQFSRVAHGGASVARNVAIGRARSPWLVLYDDDLRPGPELIEYCVDFHRRHPDDGDACLLRFRPAPGIAADPMVRWSFPLLYPFPRAAGNYGWPYFWSGTASCKKGLFLHGEFDARYRALEDAELALRLSNRVGLTVRYDPAPRGCLTRKPTLSQICRRQYAIGYFTRQFVEERDLAASFDVPPYNAPERFFIGDERELGALVASARGLERLGQPALGRRFPMLAALWSRAEAHARAEGWMAARDGRPAAAPGTIGQFLEAEVYA
jgi:glycosyltransferase involved in cell wall biosynthesis